MKITEHQQNKLSRGQIQETCITGLSTGQSVCLGCMGLKDRSHLPCMGLKTDGSHNEQLSPGNNQWNGQNAITGDCEGQHTG